MPDKNPFMAREVVAQAASPGKPKKLLEQVRDLLRLKHVASGQSAAIAIGSSDSSASMESGIRATWARKR